MLRYIHFGERPVMENEGKDTKHHLTFLFGLIFNDKILFLFTGLQFLVLETRCPNPNAMSCTPDGVLIPQCVFLFFPGWCLPCLVRHS